MVCTHQQILPRTVAIAFSYGWSQHTWNMQNASFCLPSLDDAKSQICLLTIRTLNEGTYGAPGVIRAGVSVHSTADVVGKYVAVSYTWGATSTSNILRLCHKNDELASDHLYQPFAVGANCWYALWQVCKFRFKNMLMVWIDSICIDQASHEERADQVRQMGAIYKCAGMVAACIGRGGFASQFWRRDPAYPALHLHLKDDALAYRDSIGRPYFQRLWTVQEALLSRQLHFFCGANQMPMRGLYDRISKRLNDLRQPFLVQGNEIRDDDLETFFAQCLGLCAETRPLDSPAFGTAAKRLQSSTPDDLAGMILRYQKRKCGEPRDRIYGVLSLVNPSYPQTMPTIQYDRPLVDVLLDYAGTYKKLQASTLLRDDPAAGSLFKMAKSVHTLFDKFHEATSEFRKEVTAFFRTHQCLPTEPVLCPRETSECVTTSFDMVTVHRFTPIEIASSDAIRSTTNRCSYCSQQFPRYSGQHWNLLQLICAPGTCSKDPTYAPKLKRIQIHVKRALDLLFDVPSNTQPVDFLISNHRQSTTDQIYLVCRQTGLGPQDFCIIGRAHHVISPDTRPSQPTPKDIENSNWEPIRWLQITARMSSACFLHHVLETDSVPDLLDTILLGTTESRSEMEIRVTKMGVNDGDRLLLRNLKDAAGKRCFYMNTASTTLNI